MTRRETILNKLKDIVEDIPEVSSVQVNKVALPDLDIVGFPAVFIFGGTQDESDKAVIPGQKVWEWEVFLSFWSIDEDMESLFKKIYDKIVANPTLDRTAIDCDLEDVPDVSVIDPERSMVSMSLAFKVIYRHEFGAA